MDHLDAFRAGRALKPITSSKELELLRQLCGFCHDRKWSTESIAKRIKSPRNLKPNDVEPFSTTEVKEIIKAGPNPANRWQKNSSLAYSD